MIKDIEQIKEHNKKYIQEFMQNCTIEEKIDTHYVTIDIISYNAIQIKKANGNEIDRVDLILNSMWNKLFLDWNYLKLSNKIWFAGHIGYTIKMFYFPCEQPLSTKYKDPQIRYIFDRVIYNNVDLDPKMVLEPLVFPDVYKVDYKCLLCKRNDAQTYVDNEIQKLLSGEKTSSEVFRGLIDFENSKIYGENPEGYIFKYNKKLYQTIINNIVKEDTEKTSYEFVLADFIKYCKVHNYIDKINQSYVKTICNLFNDYIINGEKETHVIENNVDSDSLTNPYIGAKFDIGYEYIPDQVTKALCQESELYKNIFKILLASLRKGKDSKHCEYLSRKQVDDWNNIMKNTKVRTRN
jgi:hypothetical protein